MWIRHMAAKCELSCWISMSSEVVTLESNFIRKIELDSMREVAR